MSESKLTWNVPHAMLTSGVFFMGIGLGLLIGHIGLRHTVTTVARAATDTSWSEIPQSVATATTVDTVDGIKYNRMNDTEFSSKFLYYYDSRTKVCFAQLRRTDTYYYLPCTNDVISYAQELR